MQTSYVLSFYYGSYLPAAIPFRFISEFYFSCFPVKFGAYFDASLIASIMLTALTIPFPAMSNAVP